MFYEKRTFFRSVFGKMSLGELWVKMRCEAACESSVRTSPAPEQPPPLCRRRNASPGRRSRDQRVFLTRKTRSGISNTSTIPSTMATAAFTATSPLSAACAGRSVTR